MADEEDVEYEIREVLNERRRGKAIEYLIDWKPTGGQTWDPTWEPAENVSESALEYYKQQKKKNAAKKKKGAAAKKRKTPAKGATKKKKDLKDKDSDTTDADDAVASNGDSVDKPSEAEPTSKRRKTTSKSRGVAGETTEEAKASPSDIEAASNGYKHLDDDDDASLYPKKIAHLVPKFSDIPLSSHGLQSDSRLANIKHYYGDATAIRLARVLRHPPDSEITDEVFESAIGEPMTDLLLRGVFAMEKSIPNRYVKRLRTTTEEILSMIEQKFSTSHRLAGNCKNIYEASSIELAEVQKRGSTLDFSLNWWRDAYPVLNRVAYHAQWYRTIIKALGHFFDCKLKCDWIGLLHSPPGSRGQVVHRDGRSKRSSESSSTSSTTAEEAKASTDDVEMFMSPNNPGVPRFPGSITVCVPLCDIEAVAEDAMVDDADLPEENSDKRHNGATEFFLSSHMSEFLAKDSASASPSSSSSARYATLKGPFPKAVVTARAGDCFGWGFDFAHNGGPNASSEARQMMYFVYNVPGASQNDENIKQFKDAKSAGSTLFMGNYSTKDDFIP